MHAYKVRREEWQVAKANVRDEDAVGFRRLGQRRARLPLLRLHVHRIAATGSGLGSLALALALPALDLGDTVFFAGFRLLLRPD